MIKWTTPTIKCTIPDGLEFDFILFTIKQNDYVVEKTIYPEQVENSEFNVFFTQQETSGFQLFSPIEAQLNVMKNGTRIATNINQLCIERNLHDEAIEPQPTTILEITQNGRYVVTDYDLVDVNIEVPTKTSQLINDSGFITSADVPTKTSQLINNSNFQTNTDVENSISAHNESAISHLDIRQLVSTEVGNRENADTELQSQIDALTSASDVTDIVGTYQELEEYDTSTLTNNDIIVVLDDSTHNNTKSYYRWDSEQEEFNYVGSDGEYYTKSVADSLFVPQTRQVNGHALSSDITLTYQDVGALSDTTHIPNKQDIKNVIDDEMAVMKYECLVNGIEQLLPANTSTPTTTPLLADIQYPDELRNDQYFNYRISPTTSDGEAEIKKIKGNSVVFNQLAGINKEDRVVNNTTCVANGDGSFTLSTNNSTTEVISLYRLTPLINIPNGHKFYLKLQSSEVNGLVLRPYTSVNTGVTEGTPTEAILTATADINYVAFLFNVGTLINDTLTVKPICVDLTLMFGAGNEPTLDEFKALFPLNYYDYNVGSLLSFNGTGLKTTGKNIVDIVSLNASTSNTNLLSSDNDVTTTITIAFDLVNASFDNLATAFFNFQKKDGTNQYKLTSALKKVSDDTTLSANTTYNERVYYTIENVTFNKLDMYFRTNSYASWSGSMANVSVYFNTDKTYEPYIENTLSLPISTYFPMGMKSAGTIYDELTQSQAIQRIGTRAYQSGDENDDAVLTDFINTNYVLNNEVITDLPQYSDLAELAENVTQEYIVLRNENGVKYKISVDTNGNLITTQM